MFKMQAMSHFSDNIRDRIIASGLSQGAVADMLGEQRSNFNRVVTGNRPLPEEKIKKLAEIPELKLSYPELRNWILLDELEKIRKEFPDIPADKWVKVAEKVSILQDLNQDDLKTVLDAAKKRKGEK